MNVRNLDDRRREDDGEQDRQEEHDHRDGELGRQPGCLLLGFGDAHVALLLGKPGAIIFVAALVLIDACVRLLPGVMGKEASAGEESFAEGLLEYPQYTRPQVWEGRAIPDVLVSGDHAKIAAYRRSEAERLIKQGAVEVNGEIAKDVKHTIVLNPGDLLPLRVGKKKFLRVVGV